VSQKDYPLVPFGRMVLNRNPQNYFAEVEQSAFAPAHMVPGIEPSPDRMLQGRLFSYIDTHRHRLGPNAMQLPINCPLNPVSNQQRDGNMVVNNNGGAAPVYFPNTHPKNAANGVEVPSATLHAYQVTGQVVRAPQQHPNSDFEQPGIFFREVLNAAERQRLVDNIVGSLCHARKEVQQRMVDIFNKCDKEYGRMVAEGLAKKANL
jgi:catalase